MTLDDPQDQYPFHVLVVDESPSRRSDLARLLARIGYDWAECDDASSAWKALEERSNKTPICFVAGPLTPASAGAELLARTRKDPRFDRARFVLIIDRDTKIDVDEAKKKGIHEILLRPFLLVNLTTTLLKVEMSI